MDSGTSSGESKPRETRIINAARKGVPCSPVPSRESTHLPESTRVDQLVRFNVWVAKRGLVPRPVRSFKKLPHGQICTSRFSLFLRDYRDYACSPAGQRRNLWTPELDLIYAPTADAQH